ncbi:MAG: cytochrome-c peroxidase, partial [Gemmatimonadetes bacterium]|nr:cytochrome-c peroxidase [Gemmatimonadota bacterium]
MTTIRRLATLLAVSMCALLGTGMRSSPGAAGSPLRRAFEAGVDSLAESLAALDTSLDARGTGISRAAFRRTRIAYKHQETLLSYFSPSTVSILNGPLGEEDDETPARPLGQLAAFQRVEHRLFSGETLADSDRMALHDDVRWMLDVVVHFRALTGNVDVSESQMLDAARLELARVSVLSLAGVDSDESGDAIIECAEALEGIRSIIAVARGSTEPARWHALDGALGDAIAALRQNTNVETMDRLEFISTHARNVGREILMARETLAPLNLTLRSVWRPAAATLFERNAFDVTAYAPDFALAPSPDVIALGERLFNDPQLSGPRTRSCASCHLPRLAFADGLVRQTSVSGSHAVARNTPTLLNAALQPTLFNDGRVATLEAQVSVVLASPAEMGGSVDLAAARLNADTGYRAAFKR